jgi:membrane fusion protein, multidrug efflux system
VRIELKDYDPDKNPLFIGTSVVPYVYMNRPPTGHNAGKFLQSYVPSPESNAAKNQTAGDK